MFNSKLILIFTFICGIVFIMPSCSTQNKGSRYSSTYKKKNSKKKTKRPNDSGKYVFRTYPDKKPARSTATSKTLPVSQTRENIIDSAKNYLGKPYKPGGKRPETGFDCSGFTGFIFTQNGVPISGASHDIAKMGKQKPKEQLIPGDLVFFGNSQRISHVAIVSSSHKDRLEVIHSTTSAGVKIDNITGSPYWESRYLFGIDVIDSVK